MTPRFLRLLHSVFVVVTLFCIGCGKGSLSDDGSDGSDSGGRTKADKSVHVEGYYDRNGKWVKPYDRAAPGEGVKKRK